MEMPPTDEKHYGVRHNDRYSSEDEHYQWLCQHQRHVKVRRYSRLKPIASENFWLYSHSTKSE